MSQFIEFEILYNRKETKITVAKSQIICIMPKDDKTKIVLNWITKDIGSFSVISTLTYEEFIKKFEILQ